MNKSLFPQLLYCKSIDTALVSQSSEVDELTNRIYDMLIDHELKNKSAKVKTTLKIVLLNLYSVHLSDPSLFIKYSRDENFYGKRLRRYVGNSIAYSSFITKIIPGLLRLRLIEDHKGFNDRREFGNAYLSRMKAKPKLIRLFELYGIQPWMLSVSEDKEVIFLKDNKKTFTPYKDTSFTNKAREDLQHINRHLESAVIDLDLSDEAMTDLLRKLRRINPGEIDDKEKHLSMFTDKTLRRIFSNSSWKLHGRFYGGFWQNIPERKKKIIKGKEVKVPDRYRQHILINGNATIELDYSSFHPKMIHDLAGVEMTGDPYEGIGDLDRDHGKSIFNKMINAVGKDKAESKEKAIGAYMNEFNNEGITKLAATAALEAVLERHSQINKYFFSGKGLKLMYYDSQIANNVMLRAIDEYQTVLLPLHDSFICVREFEDKLRQLMREEYIEVMKSEVSPKIDMKQSEYYLSRNEIAEQELYRDEYGDLADMEIKPDPKQKLRRELLEKPASSARSEYGIRFEDVFWPESIEEKYAPNDEDDYL